MIAALSMGAVGDVAAQTMYGGWYGLSQSLSDTKDFANDFSFRNVGGETRTMISDDVSIGASIAWHVFHEEQNSTVSLSGIPVDASGLQFRTINALPMMLTVHKYFGAPRQARAYVGAGAGLGYTRARLDAGILGIDETSWDFAVTPEVGYFVPMAGFSELVLSARYLWSTGDLGTQAIAFSVGVMSWPFSF